MHAVITLLTVIACIAVCPAQAKPRRLLTDKEAFSLVQAYVGPAEAKWGVDGQPDHDGFAGISMINPAPGAEGFDMYDVDLRTGDLWRTSVCEHLSNARLRMAQRKLRRRINLTAADYRRLKRPGGECRYE